MAVYALPAASPRKIGTMYQTVTAITPADNTAFAPFQAFMVNVAGNIVICPEGQTTTVTLAVLAGTIYPIAIQGVNATSTTATGIFGFG